MSSFYNLSPQQQSLLLQQLVEKALRHWSFGACGIELVKYRENAVFKVTTGTGERYAMRIHRPGYHSRAALRSELQWMEALRRDGIPVPRVIPALDGRLSVAESVESIPEARDIDVFAWIDGTPLGSAEIGLNQAPGDIQPLYFSLGKSAARLHNHSSRWTPPEGFERHAWDTEGLVGESPFWGRFWELELLDEGQKKLLQEVRQRVWHELEGYDRSPSRYSMIHADFVPDNLMVDGKDIRLIDFDDAGFGWHMFELATALYFIQEDDYYPAAKRALVDGYRSERALPEEDLARLDLFLTARGCTYLGWIRSRQETETARELATDLIGRACRQAERFMSLSKA